MRLKGFNSQPRKGADRKPDHRGRVKVRFNSQPRKGADCLMKRLQMAGNKFQLTAPQGG